MRMRMEKGGPVAQSAEEVDKNARRHASSTETLIQDSGDQGQLMHNPGSTVARDLNSTATSMDPAHQESPSSVPAFKDPPERIQVQYELIGPHVSSDHGSSASPGKASENTSFSATVTASSDASQTTSTISELRPLAPEAYGCGLYGHDDSGDATTRPSPRMSQSRSSDSQSAEGPPTTPPAHVHEPPSTGDRDLDITGQSYIQ
ncbi:hypothetical protein GOP47_0030467 [Adiantum capillus-veneris]|nr:hypothetical protein GOP47_0030467 [Adiantum capillus-veneris]